MDELLKYGPILVSVVSVLVLPAFISYLKKTVLAEYMTKDQVDREISHLKEQIETCRAEHKEDKKLLWTKFDVMSEKLTQIEIVLARIDERTAKHENN